MDPELKDDLEYFRWLRDQHNTYVKLQAQRFRDFHNQLSEAIIKKIAELEAQLP